MSYPASDNVVHAGDVAYNGVQQYLTEGGDGGLDAWIRAVDKVRALRPRAVVAGHKDRLRADDLRILERPPSICAPHSSCSPKNLRPLHLSMRC
jgi:glyoxylase-like metal-dependent hydrolase (beta-lactamase superfamily II)